MPNPSQFTAHDSEQALLAWLQQSPNVNAAGVNPANVAAIGAADFNDDDQLVMQLPAVRTRYLATQYKGLHDNQNLTYDCDHLLEVWVAAEDLSSKEAQRAATLTLLAAVAADACGQRLQLADGTASEPVRLLDARPQQQEDLVGTIYILRLAVPGIAQFQVATV